MNRERISDYLFSLEPEPDLLFARLRQEAETDRVPILRRETESFLRTLTAAKKPARILEIGTAIGYSTLVMARAFEGARIVTIESYAKRIPLARAHFAEAGCADRIRLLEGDAGVILKTLCETSDDLFGEPSGELSGKPSDDLFGEPSGEFSGGLSDKLIGELSDKSSDGPSDKLIGEPSAESSGEPCTKPSSELFDLVFLDAAKAQYLNWLPDILRLMRPQALLIADNVLQDETVMESRFTIERRERTTHARMREFLYEIKHNAMLISSVLPLGDGVSLSVKR